MSKFKLVLTVCLTFICLNLFAQFSVNSDRVSSRYDVGEQAFFNITAASPGTATYRIGYDEISEPIETGTINIQGNGTATIPFSSFEAAHVVCEVTQNGMVQKAAASFSSFDIEPISAPPADFKAFWNSQIASSNNVPLNPTLTTLSSTQFSTTYKIFFSNIDSRIVAGYITIPKGTGPFPCVVTLPAYGNDPNIVEPEAAFAEWTNAISITLSIHNTYDIQEMDPNSYVPDVIDDREGIYYKYGIMGAIRAIDYVQTRSDFDQTNVAAYGVSQGGGLAILLAGIDDRVNVLINSSPTLCQHDGHYNEKASGFPYYINRSRGQFGTAAHEQATLSASSYYDAVHAASFFDGHTLMGVSYLDGIAPAGSVFPAFNNINGEHKVMIHSSKAAHDNSTEFWDDKFKMLRLAWPQATANPPFQWAATTTGYVVEAGDDINSSNNSVNLSGTVSTDAGINNSFPVKWEKVSGPGNVSFSNQFNRNSSATFSTAGTYVLKLRAEDETNLAYKNIFYSVEDFIVVNAGGGGTTQQNQTISFPNIADKLTTDTPFSISATASSGLNVTLSLVSGPATLNGNTITLTGQEGPVIVKAEQAGNSNFFAATTVFRSFNVTAPIVTGGGGDCTSTSNVALNKSATQSATQLNAGANRGVDGNTNGNFWSSNSVTYTNWDANSWWEVDLGTTHNIEEIKIWNRTDCCQGELSNYHIFISENPFSSDNLSETINQNGVTDIVQNTTAGFPTTIPANNTSGRYVRIQLSGTGILALAEVEVIGCTGTPTGCTTVGQSCNDNNACTTNDVFDADCNCFGTFADADNDSVCDANDICPGGDDNADADNDGIPDFCDGCSDAGQPCNDGNACTTNDVYNAACDCIGTFADADNDSVCDANDICPGGDDNLDEDGDGVPDFCDEPLVGGGPCPTTLSGYTFIGTHGGHNYFISNNQKTFPEAQADAAANGAYVVAINNGVENEFIKNNISELVFIGLNDAADENDFVWPNGDPLSYTNIDQCDFCVPNNADNDYMVMAFWNGAWSFSHIWSQRKYIIEFDCDGGGGCTTIGQTCNDGDDCTSNDTYDANCNCVGSYQDSDGDGVCNSEDICNGFDDNIDSDSDGTPDGCDSTPNGGGNGDGGNDDCANVTNLALNKPATQSGTQLGSVASRANDGNTDGNYWGAQSVSNTDWVDNPWWEVDLGAIYNIQDVNIWNRTDCCQSALSNYHILISENPFTSTNLQSTINQNGVTDLFESNNAGTPSVVSPITSGRYVRIQKAGSGVLVLAEVEIMGCTNSLVPPVSTVNYCGSNGNSTTYEYIESFNVGSIVNESGSNNGYGDFTFRSTNIQQGTYFTFNMTPGFTGQAGNVFWKIWIDLNGDGDFYDSNEEVFRAISSSYRSGSAYIPSSSITGNTRMRVSMNANGYPGPCQVFSYGEVEDYNINIYGQIAPLISEDPEVMPVEDFTLTPNPVADVLVVELSENYSEFNDLNIQIYNAQGVLINKTSYNELPFGNKFLIETGNFNPGYYLLSIERDNIVKVQPFIKMRN